MVTRFPFLSWWVCWALLLALFLATLGCGGSAASPAADAAPPDGAPPSDATDAGLADGPLPSFGDCGPGSIAQAPSGLMTIEDLYVDDGGIVIHTLDGIFAGPAGGPWTTLATYGSVQAGRTFFAADPGAVYYNQGDTVPPSLTMQPRDGGAAVTLLDMPADEGAVDADNLYVGASGAIYQVPKSGASPTTLLPSGGPSGPPLRFAGGSLYWITDTTAVYSQENIVMLSPPSATPTTLVTVDAGQDPQDPYLPYAFITDLDVEGHTVAYVVGQGGGGNSPPSSSVAEVGGADLGAGGAPLRVGGTAVYFATADRTGIARYDGATGKTSVIVPGPLAETDVLALALTPQALYFATASCIYRTGL